jgi:hypothetical protein
MTSIGSQYVRRWSFLTRDFFRPRLRRRAMYYIARDCLDAAKTAAQR